jgi:hypothetical protein
LYAQVLNEKAGGTFAAHLTTLPQRLMEPTRN